MPVSPRDFAEARRLRVAPALRQAVVWKARPAVAWEESKPIAREQQKETEARRAPSMGLHQRRPAEKWRHRPIVRELRAGAP
jgi:hypothetical protein